MISRSLALMLVEVSFKCVTSYFSSAFVDTWCVKSFYDWSCDLRVCTEQCCYGLRTACHHMQSSCHIEPSVPRGLTCHFLSTDTLYYCDFDFNQSSRYLCRQDLSIYTDGYCISNIYIISGRDCVRQTCVLPLIL